MPITFENLVQKVVRAIGEVEGSSVQLYSEPRIEDAIKQAVEFVMKKHWWDHYMAWYDLTLDGTNGIVISNELQDVKNLEDFRIIFYGGTREKLTQLPQGINPFLVSGTKPLYYSSLSVTDTNYLNRKLQFWPKAATGNVVIHARLIPTIVTSTILYLDEDLLTYGAAWLILEDEDVNAAAAAKHKAMFDQRFSDIMMALGDQPIENPKGQYDSNYLTDWSV